MVEMSIPRYSFHVYPIPMATQYLDYFKDQQAFISCLKSHLRQKLLIKLDRVDFGWKMSARWSDSMPDIRIVDRNEKMVDLIKKSRIYISTYNATTHLESLAWNIPTIMFWNPLHWELNEEATKYFELLEKLQRVRIVQGDCQIRKNKASA